MKPRAAAGINFEAIRREVDAEMSEAWVAKYGDASWNAALVVMGVLPPSTPANARVVVWRM